MYLNEDEQAILNGARGETMQKVLRTVIAYGEAFGADRLVAIEGSPHLVGSFGANTIKPYFRVLDEVIAAGLKTQQPFTVDPRPMDYDTLRPSPIQRLAFQLIFGRQAAYEKQLHQLGLKDERAFTCACYLPEVGNTPRQGACLAWSESSAVAYANSVLGARTNRNSAGIDILCDVLGKAPRFGLLTDEGRQATWLIEVRTRSLPNPQLLGSAIGMKVMEEVPFITGLDVFLGYGLNPTSEAFLKDMGAASASNGAVGLYHVENITPEAASLKRRLLREPHQTYVIDDAELQRVLESYPVLWKNTQARPKLIFIGCPHLSSAQVEIWTGRIQKELAARGQRKTAVPVYLCSAPDIVSKLQGTPAYAGWLAMNVHLTTICPLMYMNNPLCAMEPIVTSSNKLRTYSSARYFMDEVVLEIAMSGKIPQGEQHARSI